MLERAYNIYHYFLILLMKIKWSDDVDIYNKGLGWELNAYDIWFCWFEFSLVYLYLIWYINNYFKPQYTKVLEKPLFW